MSGREDREEDLIVLTDEEGNEHEFTLVDVIEVEEKRYAILIPSSEGAEDEEEETAVIMRVETDENGEEVLSDIEDEEEFDRVAEAWDEIMAEEDFEEQAGEEEK